MKIKTNRPQPLAKGQLWKTRVIGGVIQTNNSINVSQVPLLGNIPWLGNLFKHTTVSTSNQELIFFITPRIIQT